MSTLKTHNLQSPDAGSVNIALASNAGMVVAGISTFNNNVNVSGTIETTGSELKITGAEPRLTFTDTDNNPDFQIWANAQKFAIYDSTNSATRFHINSSGKIGIGTETPDTLVEIGNAIGTGIANLLKLTSYTNSQSSRPALVFWNNNPNTAQAQISAKGGASYNASKLFFSVANTSRSLVDRVCIDEYGTLIVGGGESRRNTKGSNQYQALLIEGTDVNSTRMSMIRSSNDDNAPEIQIIKTRGTSVGSVTKPNQNDYLGSFTFMAGDDNDLFTRGAEISVQATGTPANDRCPSDITFSTASTSGATTPQERLRITSEGRIGIDTDSPAAKLNIVDTSNDGAVSQLLKLGNNSSGSGTGAGIQLGAGLGNAGNSVLLSGFYDGTGTSFTVETCNTFNGAQTEKFRITNIGRVGIGTDSPDQTVHIHKGSAGSVSSTSNSVLTLENSTTNVLQFLNPNNTAAQVRFGDPQDDGAGFIEYSHNANTMSFGVYGPTRMQIDSNGHLGINVASVTQLANSKQLTLRPTDDDGIRFVRPGDGNNNPNVHLDLTTTTSGSAYPSGEAYTVKYKTMNCDQIFETYEGGGTGGHIAFKTAPQGGTATERLTIHKNGGIQISNTGNVSPFTPNTSGITGGLVLTTPVYSEYHFIWSGHSSYTIDLTCASYFSSEFTYVQHQTNGGSRMQQYARGKWSNNHHQHTLNVWEWSGSGGGLSVSFTASDQSGGGSINGLSNMSNNGSTYSGFVNGGGENYSTTANGRFRISETYNWGSVSSRGLILRVYYGSFAISKS